MKNVFKYLGFLGLSLIGGFLLLFAVSLLTGCGGVKHNADPTPQLSTAIEGAGYAITLADNHLAQKPPAVPEARTDLKAATTHIQTAKTETVKVSAEFNRVEAQRVADEEQIKKLNASFFSPRQKHLFFWAVFISVTLGVLAAVGNFFPGWWSLPALFATKAVRFVTFAGIPHLVSLIHAAYTFIRGLFHKEQPAPQTYGAVTPA